MWQSSGEILIFAVINVLSSASFSFLYSFLSFSSFLWLCLLYFIAAWFIQAFSFSDVYTKLHAFLPYAWSSLLIGTISASIFFASLWSTLYLPFLLNFSRAFYSGSLYGQVSICPLKFNYGFLLWILSPFCSSLPFISYEPISPLAF